MDVHNDQSATPMIILAAPVVAPVTRILFQLYFLLQDGQGEC
jgi:hypothetical protein